MDVDADEFTCAARFWLPGGVANTFKGRAKKEKGRSKFRFGPPAWISATIYPAWRGWHITFERMHVRWGIPATESQEAS